VVSGVGFANYLNAPPAIGGATANTGAFTTLSASGALTASANVIVTQRTGYLFGNNTSPVTASTTIPNTAITGLGTMSTQNANAVAITGGTINNVSLSNITYGGLGTMATQNANAVAITGGAINGTVLGNTGASTAIFTNMNTTTGNATTMNVTSSTITNLRSSNATITGSSINGTLIGNATPSSGAFTTLTASANVAFDTNVLFVNSVGNNVSVGTTTTSAKFEVQAGALGNVANNTVEMARFDYTASNGEFLRFYGLRNTNGTDWTTTTTRIQQRVDATDQGYIDFNPPSGNYGLAFGSASTEYVRIANGGNVGIGNTAPASKLTVAGVIRSTTGGVTFPDGTTQTTAAVSASAALNVTLQQSYGGF
jgi:hypothetical protein